jgi:hypothetical protein
MLPEGALSLNNSRDVDEMRDLPAEDKDSPRRYSCGLSAPATDVSWSTIRNGETQHSEKSMLALWPHGEGTVVLL